MSSKHTNDWPFKDPKNVAVFTTADIITARMPILYVSHDVSDNGWQFHSGHKADITQAKLVCLHEIVAIDPTIKELADLPEGSVAERATAKSPWRRYCKT